MEYGHSRRAFLFSDTANLSGDTVMNSVAQIESLSCLVLSCLLCVCCVDSYDLNDDTLAINPDKDHADLFKY